MFGFLKPRESRFFELFQDLTTLMVEAAEEFSGLLSDLGHAESRAKNIKDIEHRADDVTHKTIELLHTTFITPLDREDIHELIKELDDVVDFLEAAAQRISLYGITQITPEALNLAKVCILSTQHVHKAVQRLSDLKNHEQIIAECVEINRLENEADTILRDAIARLFRDEKDVRTLIKLKEIYELLEVVTDRCEDVANIIEGIVLEYA